MPLSDRLIKERALEYGMITPFIEHQVKEVNGQGVVSYGLSSYGYDIRVDTMFKVFTPTFMPIVDPKNFDQRCFVDVEVNPHDAIIIPPNSFALAQSMETFNIPRDILALCVGKSTYARCFTGDTRVALVDGTCPTLEEMASDPHSDYWGYTILDGHIAVTKFEQPRFVATDNIVEVILDNGESVRCTPDHKFMLRNGTYTAASELCSGDSLMPLYKYYSRGYEMLLDPYSPSAGMLRATHSLSDHWNIRHDVYSARDKQHRHHIDGNKLNNVPTNITRVDIGDHIRFHNAQIDPMIYSVGKKAYYRRLRNDQKKYDEFKERQRGLALSFWNDDKYADQRRTLLESRKHISYETRQAMSISQQSRWKDNDDLHVEWSVLMKKAWDGDQDRRTNQAEVARRVRTRHEITESVVIEALNKTGSIRGAAKEIGCDRSVFRRFPTIVDNFKKNQPNNHKVVSVRELPGMHDTFCLTVPESGNFALASGVFVSNCGMIVNITPSEPMWRGILTIEISNTTPLPAKVYACEGIAQMIFFQADEVCEVSYADKKGKYQNQQGIVVAKV